MNGRATNNYYLELYLMCKEFKCLPYEGGYLDQPAIYAQAFGIIKGIINQYAANKSPKERR